MEDKLNKILELVSEYVKEKQDKEIWKPGDWIQYSGPTFDENEFKAAIEQLMSGWLIFGKNCVEFEKEFAKIFNRKYASFTNSGSSANLLMLAALTSKKSKHHLPPGSAIVVPACSFPTTVNPIIQCGFEPIFVDVTYPELHVNLDQFESMCKNGTKFGKVRAIMFAHVLGNPPNIDKLLSICEKYDVLFLNDTCDAVSSKWDGKPLGSFGLMSTVSLFPAHEITTGQGGIVFTDDSDLHRIVNSMKSWGRDCVCYGNVTSKTVCNNRFQDWLDIGVKYDHRYVFGEIGYNLNPLDLQGAIGLQQLKKLPELEQARKDNFKKLKTIFSRYNQYFDFPASHEKADVVWFSFMMSVKERAPFTRNQITEYFESCKIQTRPYFSGNLTKHPAYKEKYGTEMFPCSDLALKNSFMIGVYSGMSDEKIQYVAKCLDSFIRRFELGE